MFARSGLLYLSLAKTSSHGWGGWITGSGSPKQHTGEWIMEPQLIVFITASILVILTPGQDLLLVMSRAVAQGSKAGIVTAAGVSVGLLGHTVLTALGLGALLLASEGLFTVLKYVGAAYLLYLGIQLLGSRSGGLHLEHSATTPLKKLFLTGALSNISNPKITIFYFAFLPQFIPASASDPGRQLALLGIAFSVLTFLIKGPIGYLAGILSAWLRSRPGVITLINRAGGAVLISLGIKLALERR